MRITLFYGDTQETILWAQNVPLPLTGDFLRWGEQSKIKRIGVVSSRVFNYTHRVSDNWSASEIEIYLSGVRIEE